MASAQEALRFRDFAGGRAYHAALVSLTPAAGGARAHGHADFFELLMVIAGRMQHRSLGGVIGVSQGDVLFVRPGDVHELAVARRERCEFINVAFPADTWRRFVDLAQPPELAQWMSPHRPHRAQLSGARWSGAFGAFERALQEFQRAPTRLGLASLLGSVVPVLTEEVPAAAQAAWPDWLVHACSAMQTPENLACGLPRLLQLSAVSHGHLVRSFRRYLGCSPGTWIARQQLQQGALLLATTTASVGHIAAQAGFGSQSYFSRVFKASYGMSPSDYRRGRGRGVVP